MADINFGVDFILDVINRLVLDKILNTRYLDQNNDNQNQEQNAANNP